MSLETRHCRLLLVVPASVEWDALVGELSATAAVENTVFEPVLRTEAAEAQALLEHEAFDAVAVDLNLCHDGARRLLSAAAQHHPQLLRLAFADDAANPAFAEVAHLAHLLLPQPCAVDLLRTSVETVLVATRRVVDAAVGAALLRLNTMPDTPAMRRALLELLAQDDVDVDQIEEGLNRDPAMMAKVLQIANSAYYGSRFEVASVGEAIAILGLDTVRGIIAAGRVFTAVGSAELASFPLAELWQHSVATGVMVRRVGVPLGAGVACNRAALTAALLHDVGKLVLLLAYGERYGALVRECAKRGCQLWTEEIRHFGLHHGTAGARLLDLWGLPSPVVAAVEWHHRPHCSSDETISPLTLVHLANGLAHGESRGLRPDSVLDVAYLRRLLQPETVESWVGAEAAVG